ncbi:MAG: hypothetical protein ACRCTK_04335 [Alphaproteobacteria bacterium]
MKFLHKKWLLLSCALLVTNPLLAMMGEDDDGQGHHTPGRPTTPSSSYECLQ